MPLLSLPVLLLITDSNAHFLWYQEISTLIRVCEANLVKLFAKQITFGIGNFYAYPEFAKQIS